MQMSMGSVPVIRVHRGYKLGLGASCIS